MRHLLLGCAIGLTIQLAQSSAQAQELTGLVSSAQEGPMEGVLVSVRGDGSSLTTTVVSDDKGRYKFPAGRLEPGRYAITMRAVGYELAGPDAVEIGPRTATADLTLRPAADISEQLTNTEWLMSFPVSEDFKLTMYGCTSCHTLERIAKSSHTTQDFATAVLPRMANYASQSFPLLPQIRKKPRNMFQLLGPLADQVASALSTVNLHATEKWSYPLKTLPRPTGRATHVIYTEYDLPRPEIQPHDIVVDKAGTVWFSDFGENLLGKMDAKTGVVEELPYGVSRPGFPNGSLDLELDAEGVIWLAMMNQSGFARFDTKTGKFDLHPLPEQLLNDATQQSMVAPLNWKVDGKVWFNEAENRAVGRVDMKTGAVEMWKPYEGLPGPHAVYGIYSDSKNNLYFCDFQGETIGRVDARSGEITFFTTPTRKSRPRRARMDAEDRLWFAELAGGKVGMLDTKTGEFREWDVPTPYSSPYDAVADRWGSLWTSGMLDDRVTRIDIKTGEAVEYLYPRPTNVRRVFVDQRGERPVFWTGANHSAFIVSVEPLD